MLLDRRHGMLDGRSITGNRELPSLHTPTQHSASPVNMQLAAPQLNVTRLFILDEYLICNAFYARREAAMLASKMKSELVCDRAGKRELPQTQEYLGTGMKRY